jgi:hypothetical protein
MPDQSGSGYDLALACFGVRVGLGDQQIADLIIHHRRLHGAQQRRTVDYFQRTISTAKRDTPAPDVMSLPQDWPSHEGADGDGPADDVARKTQICQQLSSRLGVQIVRILKVPGSHPVYLMELENCRIEFDIAGLTTQRRIQLALAAHADRVIPKFNPTKWRELAQLMINACTVVDATDDLKFEEAGRIHLHRYLSENPVLSSVEEVTRRDILKPVLYRGRVTVHTTDLHSYLSQTGKLNTSVQCLAGMLTAIGAREVRIREGAYRDQSRWNLPPDQFPPGDYLDADPEGDGDAA